MIIDFHKGSGGGGTGSTEVIDNLTSHRTDAALSANQGRVLNENKQETLVSGTNIKTVNNQTLLGSGNIEISGSGVDYTAGTNINIENHIISVTGITVPTKTSDLTNDSGFVTETVEELDNFYEKTKVDEFLAAKQDTLVSGTDIKTINNQNILGQGNLEIKEGIEYSAGTNIQIASRIISVTGINVPTKTSELLNDNGFITKEVNDLTNYYTSGQTDTAISAALAPYYTSGQTDSAISTAVANKVGSTSITTIWRGSQSEYDAIEVKDYNTFYIIV